MNLAEQIEALKAQVAETLTVEQSALTLIQGFKSVLAAAIADALAKGASADQLQAIQDAHDALHNSETALAASVAENTPAAPPAPPAAA